MKDAAENFICLYSVFDLSIQENCHRPKKFELNDKLLRKIKLNKKHSKISTWSSHHLSIHKFGRLAWHQWLKTLK